MDEIIVRVTRTIACTPRLRILSCLARAKERTPTDLARDLEMPKNVVSTHLRRLSSAGLLHRRRSGTWCYCAAESAYSDEALSGKAMAWLRAILAAPKRTAQHCGVRELRNVSAADLDAQLHAIIFDAATAFTDLRRLQMLRYLTTREEATVEAFIDELCMSEYAVSRHASKLRRRGYVTSKLAGHGCVYRLASEFKTPVHRELFEMVLAECVKT